MQYTTLGRQEREELFSALDGMSRVLDLAFSGLGAEQARTPGPNGSFAPVEQVWHLADLEREGFGRRIERLLSETEPTLPDFDGAAVAAARNYRARSLAEGLSAFRAARQQNLSVLRALDSESWTRKGTQEGVGPVSVCDIPYFMSQHDAAHRAEIEEWKRSLGRHG